MSLYSLWPGFDWSAKLNEHAIAAEKLIRRVEDFGPDDLATQPYLMRAQVLATLAQAAAIDGLRRAIINLDKDR